MSKNRSASQSESLLQKVQEDPEEKLDAIMDGLAETVLEASDEEILAESCEQGRDPLKEAEEVRKILLDALKAKAPEAEPRHQQHARRAGTA